MSDVVKWKIFNTWLERIRSHHRTSKRNTIWVERRWKKKSLIHTQPKFLFSILIIINFIFLFKLYSLHFSFNFHGGKWQTEFYIYWKDTRDLFNVDTHVFLYIISLRLVHYQISNESVYEGETVGKEIYIYIYKISHF